MIKDPKAIVDAVEATLQKCWSIRRIRGTDGTRWLAAWRVKVCELPEGLTIYVFLPKTFPHSLAKIQVTGEPSLFGVLPHVGADGSVCIRDEANVIVDPSRPGDTVVDCVERAIAILTRDPKSVSDQEFVEEFNHFWGTSQFLALLSSYALPGELNLVSLERSRRNLRFIVSESKSKSVAWIERSLIGKATFSDNTLFLPLRAFGRPPYPRTDDELYFRLRNFDRRAFKKWKRFLSRKRGDAVVVATLPTSSGPTVFAWRHYGRLEPSHLNKPKVRAAILKRKSRRFSEECNFLGLTAGKLIEQLSGERVDRSRLIKRTRGSDGSTYQNVLFVGEGALGSHISEGMVLSRAFQTFTTVENQSLGIENVPRHLCRYLAVGSNKALAVGSVLQQRDPELEVRTYTDDIIDCLPSVLDKHKDIDLVVLALGSRFIETEITSILGERLPKGVPIHSVFVTKDAATGYIIRTIAGQPGCLACFFEAASKAERDEWTPTDADILREPGCAAGFANYGGDRMLRFTAMAVHAILTDSDSPFVAKWIAAPAGKLAADQFSVSEISPVLSCVCAA